MPSPINVQGSIFSIVGGEGEQRRGEEEREERRAEDLCPLLSSDCGQKWRGGPSPINVQRQEGTEIGGGEALKMLPPSVG